MINVYIVEESTWDHHENIAIFSTLEKAVDFCNSNYVKNSYTEKELLMWASDQRNSPSYYYSITEYDVDAS